GKLSSVHPNFAPHALLLISHQDPVRGRTEQNTAAHADCMGLRVARKTERIAGDERIVRRWKLSVFVIHTIRQIGMPFLEDLVAGRSHRRHWTDLVILRPHPRAGKVAFRRRSRRVRHLWNACGDKTRRRRSPALSQYNRRKRQYRQDSSY